MTTQQDPGDPNTVHLEGKLAADGELRLLPSGDELVVFRVNVRRPASTPGQVDTIECQSARASVRRVLARAVPGDRLEVRGRLQRRFWRGPAGVQSRYSVEAHTVSRVQAPDAPRRRAAGRPNPGAGRRAGA